jgi:hypothetical protein
MSLLQPSLKLRNDTLEEKARVALLWLTWNPITLGALTGSGVAARMSGTNCYDWFPVFFSIAIPCWIAWGWRDFQPRVASWPGRAVPRPLRPGLPATPARPTTPATRELDELQELAREAGWDHHGDER